MDNSWCGAVPVKSEEEEGKAAKETWEKFCALSSGGGKWRGEDEEDDDDEEDHDEDDAEHDDVYFSGQHVCLSCGWALSGRVGGPLLRQAAGLRCVSKAAS